ncbi:MAG: hypothetical protein QM743_11480 [Chitinophagaceae bacterium]
MKKSKWMILAAGVCLSAITSCKKEVTQPSSKQSKYSLERTVQYPDMDLVGKSKHWDIMEGSGKIKCPWDPGKCYKKKKSIADDMEISSIISYEMSVIDRIISESNNANLYFQTANWRFMFSQVADVPGLLEEINSNRVNFFKIQTIDNDVSVAYVVSTAATISEINNENIILSWEY